MTTDERSDLVGLICDAVEFFCNENMVSGEEAWRNIEDLTTIKLHQMRGNRL